MQSENIQFKDFSGIPGGMDQSSSTKLAGDASPFVELFQNMLLDRSMAMKQAQVGPVKASGLGKKGRLEMLGHGSSGTNVKSNPVSGKNSFYGISKNKISDKTTDQKPDSSKIDVKEVAKGDSTKRADLPEKVRGFIKKVDEMIRKNEIKDTRELLEAMKEDPQTAEVLSKMTEEAAQQLAQSLLQSSTLSGDSMEISDDKVAIPAVTADQSMALTNTIEANSSQKEDGAGLSEEDVQKLLETLRADSRKGDFWKSLDDQTALQLLQSLTSQASQNQVAVEQTPEGQSSTNKGFLEFSTLDQRRLDSLKSKNEGKAVTENTQNSGNQESDDTVISKSGMEAETAEGADSKKEVHLAIGDSGKGEANLGKTSQDGDPEPGASAPTVSTTSVISSGPSSDKALSSLVEMMNRQNGKTEGGKNPGIDKPVVLAGFEGLKIRRDTGAGAQHSGLGQGFPGNPTREVYNGMSKTQSQESVRGSIFSQLIEKASLLKGPQMHKTLTIQLKPEFLGKVQMELTSKDGNVSARIMTESAAVKDRIDEIAPQIKDHLAEMGIKFDHLTVDVSSQNSDGKSSDSFFEASRFAFGSKGKRRGYEPAETEIDVTGTIVRNDPLAQGVDITI